MKGWGAQQVRDAEAPHLAAGEPLMERASAALARECDRMLEGEGVSPAHARVVVLVGGGNNGGDALFAAATLAQQGARVELVRASSRVHEEGLAAALAAGATVVSGGAAKLAASADLIVDGILGTGTSADPRLRGDARELVAAIAAAKPSGLVVAVDIPSGIHPDSGEVPDPAAVLRADVTVTFGGAKAGLLLPPARDFAGEVRVYDIGLAADLEKLTPLVEVDA
ncbi:hypothetical protein GCM10022286_20040 [Gryllotalpicola daejeonensis]|uniref:NAD(P)H-hydrate epimerase n=1 Tax=Gryllotalpicola daejeonensis TaxID=993087 RepID=A0ABP7ZKM8_9MICO